MCDSVINTLLNIQGNSKDGLNTRQDLAEMGILNSYIQLMLRKYTCLQHVILSQERRRQVSVSVCVVSKCHKDTLQNIKGLVQLKDLKISCLKVS